MQESEKRSALSFIPRPFWLLGAIVGLVSVGSYGIELSRAIDEGNSHLIWENGIGVGLGALVAVSGSMAAAITPQK